MNVTSIYRGGVDVTNWPGAWPNAPDNTNNPQGNEVYVRTLVGQKPQAISKEEFDKQKAFNLLPKSYRENVYVPVLSEEEIASSLQNDAT